MGLTGSALRSKLGDWISRYGLAECVGLTTAVLGSLLVRFATGNSVAAAYGGVMGENVGYYGVIIARDCLAAARAARAAGRVFTVRDAARVMAGLVAEFGPAELLDSGLIRPFAMGLGVRFFGPELGIVVGKIAADVVFYIPVIFVYERKKRATFP